MDPSSSTGNTPRQDVGSFRNPCGRRGCDHIFEYEGPDPLRNISRMVNEHWPHCPGRKIGATHARDAHWQPTTQSLEESYRKWDSKMPEDRSVTPYERRWSSPPSAEGASARTEDTQISGSGDGGTSSSISPRSARSSGSLPPSVEPSEAGGKKSSRTEAERRATLEMDEWVLSVTAHEVVCRGCRRPIKLDKRSRYYPGLWEKHRDRCEHIARMWILREAEASRPESTRTPHESIMVPAASSPSSSPPSSESGDLDPTALASRKSYYRGT
ncbi:hypothetical protein DFH09DRAFT_1192631 [Mycena vulgaris]|nr:hypothetical protein DFH09DRAFT_1192631 [Mycena vulgaris]